MRVYPIGLLALVCSTSHAAVVTFGLNIEFSGGTPPAGVAPWVTATITDTGPDAVTIAIVNGGLIGSEFTRGFYLNLNPAMNAANLVFGTPTQVGTFAIPSIDKGTDAFKADGDGFFDLRFNFATAAPQRFGAGESITWPVTGITGLDATDFDFLSVGSNSGLPAAAHVQGIGANGEDSGWITVPEPAAGSLLLLGAALMGRRRRV
jgi:hypothetical protein